MPGNQFYVTFLVAVVLSTTVAVTVGVQGQSAADATTERVTRQGGCIDSTGLNQCPQSALTTAASTSAVWMRPEIPPNGTGPRPPAPMSASVSQTSSNSFRIAVRNARYGQSTNVEPPSQVADSGYNTDIRAVRVGSRGGASRFDLDFTVEQDLSSLSGVSASGPPESFDTPLLYSDLETSVSDNEFGVAYDFDVETDFLQEYNARQSDVVIAQYRDGSWETVDVGRSYRSGNETVVSASAVSSGLVAVGLRHPDIRVTRIRPQNPPLLSNRTSRLEITAQNQGSRDGTATLNLTADDRSLATPSIAVSAGSERTVTVPVQFQQSGETDLEVGSYETTVNVTEPKPDITVTSLSVGRTNIETGETVRVDATVTNSGAAGGVGAVRFQAFGDVVTVEEVELSPGQTRTISFTQQFDAPGSYQLGVNNQTTTISVEPGPDYESTPADDTGTPTPGAGGSGTDDSFQWALILLGAGVVLLFGLVTVGRMMGE